ncbi:proprotein convertase subtilisin/kexin type 5-like [Haliotis asinina]|uniref:proprotein convertase subtilisin/kexin type 5-like n=1 Tax=Haliotis asinina TaxID=109174 RepID=UPI003531F8F0
MAALAITLVTLVAVATYASSSRLCTGCEDNDRVCVEGECVPKCIHLTSSGQCLQCRDSRFYGKHCEHECPDTCLNSLCQMNNSRVVCREGCVAGKRGDNCGADCDAACTQCERYGDDCIGPCQNLRYYGPHCRTPCPSACRDGCDKDMGKCRGCILGSLGTFCNVTCSSQSCVECEEDKGKCTRCNESYIECDDGGCHGEDCHTVSDATTASPREPDGLKTVHILMIVCSILSTLLMVGALQTVKKRCKRRSQQDAVTGTQAEGSGSSTYLAHKYYEINDQDVDTGCREQGLLASRPEQRVACLIESSQGLSNRDNRVREEADAVPDIKPRVLDTPGAMTDGDRSGVVEGSDWRQEHFYEPLSGSRGDSVNGQTKGDTHEDMETSREPLQLLELIAASGNADVRYLTTQNTGDEDNDISDE